MAQNNQDFTVFANNDFTIRFEDIFKESDGSILTVGDIEGASWNLSPFESEVTPLISKDLVSGNILIPEDGTVVVVIDAIDTEGLSGEFTHELRLKHSGGVQTASRGKLRIYYQVGSNPL